MMLRHLAAAAILALPLSGFAADEAAPTSLHIGLKDGTSIIIDADGNMNHYGSRRQPMEMMPGKHRRGER